MKYAIGITGATGSLGKILLKNKKNYKINIFKGNVANRNEVFNWIKNNRLNIIFHLAAIVPIKKVNKNKRLANKVNFYGTKNLVDSILKIKNIKWFFFSSTSHVYKSTNKKISEKHIKKPISFYGKSKLKAENYIIKKFFNSKTKYCIGRIFSTANNNQKKNYLVPDLKFKIKKTKDKVILKNLNHYRDFISMEVISRIIFILMKKKYQGILNLGTGQRTYLKDIALVINKKYNKKIIFIDNTKETSLIADNRKLKKLIKFPLSKKIEKLIF